MQQYFDIRNSYSDILLFFQVGDFYELFFEDAKKASAFLGITLTKRGNHNGEPIPLCGVPIHAKDHYITKLVKGGFKVALCDQLEEARPGVVVKRGVTQVFTPGTLTDETLLDAKSASYLFSFFPMENQWGLLFGELLTAQLFATVLPANAEKLLESELVRFFPDEILLPQDSCAKPFYSYFKKQGYVTTAVAQDEQQLPEIAPWLEQRFGGKTQQSVLRHSALLRALNTFYSYMRLNQQAALEQFKSLHVYQPEDFLTLDIATQQNLELVKNNYDGSHKHTLFEVVDNAVTSMGSRMIKKWLVRPLVKKEAIEQRHQVVQTCVNNLTLSYQLEEVLRNIGDIERVVGRIALNRGKLQDYVALRQALEHIPRVQELLQNMQNIQLLATIFACLGNFTSLCQLLTAALNDDFAKDWIIKPNFDAELDRVRNLVEKGSDNIVAFEQQEQQKTGISSLKVRYNNVHGYYIEVTKANMALVPERYVQRQTLVGRNRYTVPELQQLEHDILTAQRNIKQIEQLLFVKIKEEVVHYIHALRKLAHALAHLDALLGFGRTAYNNGYVQPVMHNNRDILITDGRHPVIEAHIGNAFIPNNTQLTDAESLWIITGPNMGGKSTYLRQVAHICLLAQCGSFVSAGFAQLPLLDRIFTRIGASDKLAEGKSTFLVEMEETAAICSYATEKSLVILDEVGRGTSTFDGLAIAQAVVEFLYTSVKARCLFATHYHELTRLQENFTGITSYYVASKKTEQGIIFLYHMIRGIADGSFGVEVAKLAHLPQSVITRAQEILRVLEATEIQHQNVDDNQLFSDNKILRQNNELLQRQLNELTLQLQKLQTIDYNDLSPKQALDLLWQFKEAQ